MDSKKRDVIVSSNEPDDLALVRQLLEGIGQQINIFNADDNMGDKITPRSIVIQCHRGNAKTTPSLVSEGQTPARLIILSDCLEEHHIVDSLETGTDHYFDINESPRVLSVRLKAALRCQLQKKRQVLDVEPFKFYVESRRVTHNGLPIHLSPREFSLAYFLFSNHTRTVYDTELMVTIWTLPASMDKRRIDTAICRVRNKLNLNNDESGWNLHRLRQVGYQLVSASAPRTIKQSKTPRIKSVPQHVQEPQQVQVRQKVQETHQVQVPQRVHKQIDRKPTSETSYVGKTSSRVLPSKSTT